MTMIPRTVIKVAPFRIVMLYHRGGDVQLNIIEDLVPQRHDDRRLNQLQAVVIRKRITETGMELRAGVTPRKHLDQDGDHTGVLDTSVHKLERHD